MISQNSIFRKLLSYPSFSLAKLEAHTERDRRLHKGAKLNDPILIALTNIASAQSQDHIHLICCKKLGMVEEAKKIELWLERKAILKEDRNGDVSHIDSQLLPAHMLNSLHVATTDAAAEVVEKFVQTHERGSGTTIVQMDEVAYVAKQE